MAGCGLPLRPPDAWPPRAAPSAQFRPYPYTARTRGSICIESSTTAARVLMPTTGVDCPAVEIDPQVIGEAQHQRLLSAPIIAVSIRVQDSFRWATAPPGVRVTAGGARAALLHVAWRLARLQTSLPRKVRALRPARTPAPGRQEASPRGGILVRARAGPVWQLVGVHASLEGQLGHRRSRSLACLDQPALVLWIKAARAAFIDMRDFEREEIKIVWGHVCVRKLWLRTQT